MNISGIRTKGAIKAWLPVVDGVRVLCRHMDQEEWDAHRLEATTREIDEKTKEEKTSTDMVTFRRAIGRAIVLDIDGVTDGVDGEGKPVPLAVNPENIDLLMDKWGAFRLTVMTAPMDVAGMLKKQAEQDVKN